MRRITRVGCHDGTAMKLRTRSRSESDLAGVTGKARVEKRARSVLARLRPGEVAVIDQVDLDRTTAQALADARVVAVVNAAPMISGRYPNLGPQLLVEAGVVLVDEIGTDGLAAIRDGARVRVHEGTVFAGEQELASGRELDAATVQLLMGQAREGMVAQLGSFTHNSSELLRREHPVLLDGVGLPETKTSFAGRSVVVVAPGPQHQSELRSLRRFIRDRKPVLVGVDSGAEVLTKAGYRPDVVVVSARLGEQDLPTTATLRAAGDLVAVVDPGTARGALDQFERLGVRPARMETGLAVSDAALVLAHHREARALVAVGMQTSLEDFLDTGRTGAASSYLTRLKVGSTLVDAAAVPRVHGGGARVWQVLLVLLVCLLALAAAIATTPVGQDWLDQLTAFVQQQLQ